MLSCPSCLSNIVTDYEEDIKYNSTTNCLRFVTLYDNTLFLCMQVVVVPWTKQIRLFSFINVSNLIKSTFG